MINIHLSAKSHYLSLKYQTTLMFQSITANLIEDINNNVQ